MFLHTIFIKSEQSLSTAWRECDMDHPAISGRWGSRLVTVGHIQSLGVISSPLGSIPFATGSLPTVTSSFLPLDIVLTTFCKNIPWKKETWFSLKNRTLYTKILNTVEITIIDGIKKKSIIIKSDELCFQRWKNWSRNALPLPGQKWPPATGNDPSCPEMTAVTRNDPFLTRNDCASGRCDWVVIIIRRQAVEKDCIFFSFLYSLQRHAIALAATGKNNRFKKMYMSL